MEQKNSFEPPLDVTKRKNIFESIGRFLKKRPPKKRLLLVAAVSLGVLGVGIGLLSAFGPTAAEPNPIQPIKKVEKPPEPVLKASPLTGVMADPALTERAVTGVMIENSMDARPQSGLSEAGVVFEAIAEGGITRFLALFQEAQPANLGPIRSARPYYVQWAAGFDAAYVHSGGSGEALQLIRTLGVKDLDHGNYGNQLASRVTDRFAPHNVYTSMARIDAMRAKLGFTSSKFTPFDRKADEPATATKPAQAAKINFQISGAFYNTAYSYDVSSNSYLRNMAGAPHIDRENGKQITPKVVIALITTYGIHSDGIHSVYGTAGTGDAKIFQDGRVISGKWHKASATASLSFTDVAGAPLLLDAGQTWITAIKPGQVSYTP